MSTLDKIVVIDTLDTKVITNLLSSWLNNREVSNQAVYDRLDVATALIKAYPALGNIGWKTLKNDYPEIHKACYISFIDNYFRKKENVGKIGKTVKIEGVEKPVNIKPTDCILNKKAIAKKFDDTVAMYIRNSDGKAGDYGIMRTLDTNITGKAGLWAEVQEDFGIVQKAQDKADRIANGEEVPEEEVIPVYATTRIEQCVLNFWKEDTTLSNSIAQNSKKPCSKDVVGVARSMLLANCKAFLMLDNEKKYSNKSESQIRKILNDAPESMNI